MGRFGRTCGPIPWTEDSDSVDPARDRKRPVSGPTPQESHEEIWGPNCRRLLPRATAAAVRASPLRHPKGRVGVSSSGSVCPLRVVKVIVYNNRNRTKY